MRRLRGHATRAAPEPRGRPTCPTGEGRTRPARDGVRRIGAWSRYARGPGASDAVAVAVLALAMADGAPGARRQMPTVPPRFGRRSRAPSRAQRTNPGVEPKRPGQPPPRRAARGWHRSRPDPEGGRAP